MAKRKKKLVGRFVVLMDRSDFDNHTNRSESVDCGGFGPYSTKAKAIEALEKDGFHKHEIKEEWIKKERRGGDVWHNPKTITLRAIIRRLLKPRVDPPGLVPLRY